VYLADLTSLTDKYASTCDELGVLRVEVVELKSRPALLGACSSCPVLHGKVDEMHAYTVSLEAKLKEPIPTSCSTYELHALKNLELAHHVDRLQDENDECDYPIRDNFVLSPKPSIWSLSDNKESSR
jgi:hypothetical protein